MKNRMMVISLGLLLCSYSLAEAKTSPCSLRKTRTAESEELMLERKFSLGKLLNGLAHTCHNLGKAVIAATKKEKQAAALGVVSSLLALAGSMTEKEKAQQVIVVESPVIDAESVETKMVDLVLRLVQDLDDAGFRSRHGRAFPQLKAIKVLKTEEERRNIMVEKLHACKDKWLAIIKEVLVFVKERFGQKVTMLRQAQTMNYVDDYELDHVIMLQVGSLFQALMDFADGVIDSEEMALYLAEQMVLLDEYLEATIEAEAEVDASEVPCGEEEVQA